MVAASAHETFHASPVTRNWLAQHALREVAAAAAFVLLIFQNLPLKETPLGGFGSAAAMPFIGLFLILWAADHVARADRAKVSWITLATMIYACAITVWGVVHFDFVYRDAALIKKAFMAGLQIIFFAGAIVAGAHVPRAWISPMVSISLVVNLLGALVIRGAHEISFSSEPSHFGVLTVLLALLHYHFCENRTWRLLLTGAAVLVALVSGSKGAIAALTLSLGVILFLRYHRRQGFYFIWLPILLVTSGIMMAIVVRLLLLDIENFTSVATRSAGFLTAILTAIHYPLGVGLGGFYPAFSTAVPQAWDVLTSVAGSKLNLGELFKFAYSDDRNLSSKTLFGDALIYGGWPFLLLLLTGFFRLFRAAQTSSVERSSALAMIVFFSLLASATYYVGIPHYVLPMALGVVWGQLRRT